MDECRKIFEEWIEDNGDTGQFYWECWQAAWNHPNKHLDVYPVKMPNVTVFPDRETAKAFNSTQNSDYNAFAPITPDGAGLVKLGPKTQNTVKCTYCNDTGEEVRYKTVVPCRCLTTMD